jgi:hypothetical protein
MRSVVWELPAGALPRVPPIASTLGKQGRRIPHQRLAIRGGQIVACDANVREQVVIKFCQPCEHLPSFDGENDSPEALDEHQ